MKLISLLLIASSVGTFAATEEQLNKRFAVEPGGKLIVEIDFGSIDINTNATGEVVADVWRKISRSTKSAEEEYFKSAPVEFIQDGSTVTIRAHHKNVLKPNWFGQLRSEAKYTITVPSKFVLQLNTAGGGITAKNITGDARAKTSGGGLTFVNLQGPLDGETSGGGIHMESCAGKLRIHTSGGGIKVVGGSGTLDGETSGGSITVKNFGGPAHVSTSGGGIDIENVNGEIDGSTSGGSIRAGIVAPVPGSVKLSTSGGGITVHAPSAAAFDLDASTSAGGVHTEFAVTTTDTGRGHLRGAVNGGGKTVFLRTSAGGIHIKKD